MKLRCAILDDYQNVALSMANWAELSDRVELRRFSEPFGSDAEARSELAGFEIVCAMRERTRFGRETIDALPKLRLLVTTGMANRAIDLAACAERGVTVCGTGGAGNPTVGITFGLMLEVMRRVGYENARLKAGEPWQSTVGLDLHGLTLGIVGLGRIGRSVARVAQAFGMKVVAWSQNLTPEKAEAAGATYVSKEELFRRSDVVTVHLQLSERSRGLIGASELGAMKPDAVLINTARGPIVQEAALLEALRANRIRAGLDVFDREPLPLDHPFRALDNVVLSPHLGYVTRQNYEVYFRDTLENIKAFLDGAPVRVLTPQAT